MLGIPWRVAAQLITFVLPGLLIIDCDCPQAKQEELVYLASDVQAAQSEAGSLRKQLASMSTQLEAASAQISQQQRDMAAMEEVKKQLQAGCLCKKEKGCLCGPSCLIAILPHAVQPGREICHAYMTAHDSA